MLLNNVLHNSTLIQTHDGWVLTYEGREYLRLMDAKSQDDAEQQIAEMLFLRKKLTCSDPARRHVCSKNPERPSCTSADTLALTLREHSSEGG